MSQSHRSRGTGRSTSVLAAVGFCIGIPALLCRAAGWPLPRRLPSFSGVVDAFSGGWRPDDRFVISVLAVIAWVVWAQIGAVAIAELRAMRSGRRAQTLPFSAWCRPIAVRLATALAVLTPLVPKTASAAPIPPLVAVTVTAPAAPSAFEQAPAPAAPSPAGPITTYVVRPGDTLWDVAECHLGDPLRWREIFDTNRDRVQPDGRRLDDAGLLRPGWHLDLPIAAPAPRNNSTPARPANAATADVTGEVASPAARPAPTVPAVPAPAPAETDPSSPSGTEPVTISPASESSRPGPSAVAQIGLPSLTAGVLLGYLGRLRQDRERRRRLRHRFPAPATRHVAAERRARAVAGPDAPVWVDLALRHLADSLQDEGAPPPPAVLAVRAGNVGVEVFVSPPWPVAPGRFLPVDDGHTWRLDPAVELDELTSLAKDHPAYLPALVTVGETESDALVVDLDEAGTLTVEGDVEQVNGVLGAMAAELATAPWSANCDIALVAVGDTLAGIERVRVVDPSEAVTQLSRMAGTPGTGGLADAARADIPAGPTIAVVGSGALERGDLEVLLDAAKPHSGLCVIAAVVGSGPTGRYRLTGCPDGSAILYPLGTSVTLARRSATAGDLIALLAATAVLGTDRPEPVEPAEFPSPPAEDPATAVDDTVSDSAGPSDEIQEEAGVDASEEGSVMPVAEVRLIGPIEVTWKNKPTRPQVTELVSYLAVHPRGVTSDQARLALWPASIDDDHFGERAPASLWALTTKARAALGQDGAGNSLIIRESNNSLRISPSVGCDWLEFERLVRQAHLEPDKAITYLRRALGLVRGRPFEGSAFSWVEVERLDGTMEATIADAAQQLAALALEAADLATARFAIKQGLLAVPSAEPLCRWAMKVAAAAGDRAGIERAWRDAERIATGLDSLGTPEPETVELYQSLRRTTNTAP